MRLIDAEALEQDGWCMSRTVQINKTTMEYQTRKPTDFPTIEPERKTGRWITHKIKLDGVYRSYCECTACGHTRPTTLFPLYYCPNCGAKMEGDT